MQVPVDLPPPLEPRGGVCRVATSLSTDMASLARVDVGTGKSLKKGEDQVCYELDVQWPAGKDNGGASKWGRMGEDV